MGKVKKFFKDQPVLVIAFFAAVVTMFIIPPDREYGGYCNRAVLIQLFCLMTAVGGFRRIGVFENVPYVHLHIRYVMTRKTKCTLGIKKQRYKVK